MNVIIEGVSCECYHGECYNGSGFKHKSLLKKKNIVKAHYKILLKFYIIMSINKKKR